ncbi:DNA gyrase subunit A [Thermoclostridium stercorarium subsp. stercorarium DSM 8532]|uniref:DNA gyrase subunit A n=2 Tax=Thermoclostridium stercorarium TaxID=1510 RepID=L7VSI3_THES1|nr:DNA gyrase subunit A [Thermoclostridium stercorarium subsp. stercorarium DSM 8532]
MQIKISFGRELILMSDIKNSPENMESGIIPVDIEAEMKQSFIDYAMSVIVDRALPDIRDGLKPVHRRILYTMHISGFTPDKPYRKSVATVGETLKSFHPHGDAAVYDSLVRLAQDFTMRYPLIDGHGNFGSIDGDAPAAMRYTEARLQKIALEMLRDINKDAVDFKPNFDDHDVEPVVLPSRFPNLLVNGSSGIAVGMATNIPPHNLCEAIDAIVYMIDHPDADIPELMEYIKGPDFPTGGIIIGKKGIYDAYTTGKGRIIVRAVTEIETYSGNRQRIVVTELPYQVNKARLLEKIASLVKEKRIEGISDLRDESDREGIRIVIELKKDTNANVVLNQLFVNTQLQDTFNVNMLALIQLPDGKFEPKVVNLKEMIYYYIQHQRDVIRRRTKYDLEKAEARAHILEGLKIALDHLDEVINIIRQSHTENQAKEKLTERFGLSEKQSQAIVDMRLGRLTALEREKIEEEYNELLKEIAHYREILEKPELVDAIIKEELIEIRNKYGDERRTKITNDDEDIVIEDLIDNTDIVITLTHYGYIKRTSVDEYKIQKRGGRGVMGLTTREDDFVTSIYTATTHHLLLFFTNRGKVYKLRAWDIPEAGRHAKGTAIVNLLELEPGEKVSAVIPITGEEKDMFLFMATRQGMVKKTPLEQFENIRKGGLIAVTLKEGDELIEVRLTDGNDDVILITKNGMSIRFPESDVRPMGRNSQGVIGIKLSDDDEVISMLRYTENTTLLVVTENGFGKRTDIEEYKVQNRGGKGILTYKVTEKTGFVVGAKLVDDQDDILLVNTDGNIIRLHVGEISILSRVTQGVTLMKTAEGSKVVSVARITREMNDDDEEE